MKTLTLSLLITLCSISSTFAAPGEAGGGGFGGGYGASEPRKTPEQRAVENYQRGVKSRDKALAFEQEAAGQDDQKKQQKLVNKAQKEYARAQKQFEKTIDTLPGAFEAHSDLGFVLRKQGYYDQSLATYNRALALNPEYMPAIEYRGEAYLALNQLDKAKDAYMVLFRQDRKMADVLMLAMQAWLKTAPTNAEITDAAKQEFSQWVAERLNLSAQTYDLSPTGLNPWNTASR